MDSWVAHPLYAELHNQTAKIESNSHQIHSSAVQFLDQEPAPG
jgi:hypothetical protein